MRTRITDNIDRSVGKDKDVRLVPDDFSTIDDFSASVDRTSIVDLTLSSSARPQKNKVEDMAKAETDSGMLFTLTLPLSTSSIVISVPFSSDANLQVMAVLFLLLIFSSG
jgi:hypothetical protein